jgi:hypothetical protein
MIRHFELDEEDVVGYPSKIYGRKSCKRSFLPY